MTTSGIFKLLALLALQELHLVTSKQASDSHLPVPIHCQLVVVIISPGMPAGIASIPSPGN